MITLPPDDDLLETLERTTLPGVALGVSYRLDRVLGVGGLAVAFFALRATPEGGAPMVLKIMRPRIVREAGSVAQIALEKEITALERLNERVPPTPFVVRLVDSGVLSVQQDGLVIDLPWIGLEYVHGGVEGTTLHERVDYSLTRTGFAFDPDRAAHAVECLASGLDAVHDVGVIHRDLTPANVLCCGFGEDEIFKIADFGLARPTGATVTFGAISVGTPGYAAPEQVTLDDKRIGRATDVFGFAAMIFKMLTGEEYFVVQNAIEGVMLAQDVRRRSITDCAGLSPELRERPQSCAVIDAALARATSPEPEYRPPTGGVLAATVLPALRGEFTRRRTTARHLRSLAGTSGPTLLAGWNWTVRHRSGADRVVRDAAWDGDGSCLAAGDHGLVFWNGTSWEDAPLPEMIGAQGLRFVRRVGAGLWLLGGDGGTLAHYSSDGATRATQNTDPRISFTHASGEVGDLCVLVGEEPGHSPLLYALSARRWLKPAALSQAASVAGLARLDDDRWLVCGRAADASGFAAVYSPMMWDVERVATASVRAFLTCAAQPDLGVGVVGGVDGRVVRISAEGVQESIVPGDPSISAVGIDISGRIWAGTSGALWLQAAAQPERWSCAWSDPTWTVPFVSLFVDVGLVIAMTPDGGIIEGRMREG